MTPQDKREQSLIARMNDKQCFIILESIVLDMIPKGVIVK